LQLDVRKKFVHANFFFKIKKNNQFFAKRTFSNDEELGLGRVGSVDVARTARGVFHARPRRSLEILRIFAGRVAVRVVRRALARNLRPNPDRRLVSASVQSVVVENPRRSQPISEKKHFLFIRGFGERLYCGGSS
jgi:hypothetical protein